MKIAKDSVVRFHYSVSERTAHEQGQEPLETSKEREPLAVLIGHGNIIPGLENAMQDREAGEGEKPAHVVCAPTSSVAVVRAWRSAS